MSSIACDQLAMRSIVHVFQDIKILKTSCQSVLVGVNMVVHAHLCVMRIGLTLAM